MIFTKSQFAAKIATLESTLTSLGGTIPPSPKNQVPSFYQAHGKNRIKQLEMAIAQRKQPAGFLPQGMSMEKAVEIQQRVATEKPKGSTPLLDALAKEHFKNEPRKPAAAKPAAPAPVRATAAAPVTTPAPAVSAAAIASALLDETARRAAAALVKTRAEFAALTPAEAMAFCKAKGKIIN